MMQVQAHIWYGIRSVEALTEVCISIKLAKGSEMNFFFNTEEDATFFLTCMNDLRKRSNTARIESCPVGLRDELRKELGEALPEPEPEAV